MSLNASEIGLVASLLEKALVGASAREIISESVAGRVTVVLRLNGENHNVRFVLNPKTTRVGRVPYKPKAAPIPHPFVMLLRREVVGCLMMGVHWINRDRVIRFDFARGAHRCALIAELTSRHANLFWLDANSNIGGSFFPNRSHKRALVSGNPYVPPILHDAQTTPVNRFEAALDPEASIDAFYAEKERDTEQEARRGLLLKMLRTAYRRNERLLKKLENDLERAEKGEKLFAQGHVLKAHLHEVEKGMRRLDAVDFEGNAITIELDPKLSGPDNMEKLFNKAKRFGRAVGRIEERILATMAELEALDDIKAQIEEATFSVLSTIESSLIKRYPYLKRVSQAQRGVPEGRLPYREYVVSNARTVRVGRSARDNDALTLRHAKPQDLWLHVRGESGSHVVVPMGRAEDPHPDLLVDAAHLAAYFSNLKGETDVEVIYTRRRYVQKPRGAAPGSVRLIREKTLNLRIEQDRLKKILK